MSEPLQDEQLLSASFDLVECVRLVKDLIHDLIEEEEDSERFSSTRGYPEDWVEGIISDSQFIRDRIEEKKKQAKSKSEAVIAILKNKVHLFAEFSPDAIALNLRSIKDRFDMDDGTKLPAPSEVVGTSAHHAGLLFLERALINDFWEYAWFPEEDPPAFDEQLLIARIQRERMCKFQVSERPQSNEDTPIKGPRFEYLKNLFVTEEGVEVRFTSDIHFHFFKAVYDRGGEISYADLAESIPQWKKNGSGTDENINSCRTRINQALGSAGLFGNEYKIATRKKHVIFKSKLENKGGQI